MFRNFEIFTILKSKINNEENTSNNSIPTDSTQYEIKRSKASSESNTRIDKTRES